MLYSAKVDGEVLIGYAGLGVHRYAWMLYDKDKELIKRRNKFYKCNWDLLEKRVKRSTNNEKMLQRIERLRGIEAIAPVSLAELVRLGKDKTLLRLIENPLDY